MINYHDPLRLFMFYWKFKQVFLRFSTPGKRLRLSLSRPNVNHLGDVRFSLVAQLVLVCDSLTMKMRAGAKDHGSWSYAKDHEVDLA